MVFSGNGTLGLGMSALSAITMSAMGFIFDWCQSLDLPFNGMVGMASALLGVAQFGVVFAGNGLAKVQKHEWKWILLRGILGTQPVLLQELAIMVNISPWERAAFASMAIVVFSLAVLMFQGESPLLLHWAALGTSLTGVMIHSQPMWIIYQRPGWTTLPILACAIIAGCAFALMPVTARLLKDIDSLLMCACINSVSSPIYLAVQYTGLIDPPLRRVWRDPENAKMAWLWLNFCIFVAMSCMCQGGKLCPAVWTSTTFCSVYYAFPWIVRWRSGSPPVIGAAFVMLSLILLVAAHHSCECKVASNQVDNLDQASESEAEAKDSADFGYAEGGAEHFATVIVAELAGVRQKRRPRQRRQNVSGQTETSDAPKDPV